MRSSTNKRIHIWLGLLVMALAISGCMAQAPAPAPTALAGLPAPRLPTLPATMPLAPTAAPATPAPPTARPTMQPTAAPAPSPTSTSAEDGAYLVYQEGDGSLWRSDGASAPPIRLAGPTEPEAQLPWAAAPDGQTIAIVAGVGVWDYSYRYNHAPELALWLVDAGGAHPRKIQDLLPPRALDLTPGGDDVSNLLPALTRYQQLAWSPDGQLLAFVSAHEGQVDLYTTSRDGIVTRLSSTPKLEQGPSWSPDGALVAYRSTSGFGTGAGWGDIALEVAPRTGGAPIFEMSDRKLAAGTQAQLIADLLWIGPTTLIAGLADAAVGRAELRLLQISTSPATLIFDAPYSALAWNDATGQLAIAGTAASLTQAPSDGRKLAPGLYTWRPDAGAATQIESAPVEALAWTTQGDALAYSVGGAQPGLRIWDIGAEGDVKKLADQSAQQLRWSPDDQQLATNIAIYGRHGGQLAELGGSSNYLIGWHTRGLCYATLADGSNHNIWLWESTQPQQLATQVSHPETAGVVRIRP